MTPKLFLRIAGVLLVVVGILGLLGLFGRISEAAFFHPPYWINWAHLVIGVVILSVSIWGNAKTQTIFTSIAMVFGLALGLMGLLLGRWAAQRFQLPELADPSDHIAHFIVGLLALWGWRNRAK